MKAVAWVIAALVVLAGSVYLAFQVSPWPAALLIRIAFNKDAAATSAEMAKYVPAGVNGVADVHYDESSADGYLDVYFPADIEGTERTLPTIVWIHGGAWISGSRGDVGNYIRILASHGYTTVTVDYSIAPGAQYPTPLRQVNAALAYLKAHAAELRIDASRFILAGDSAGAQIAAQMANIISVPAYAETVRIVPAIERERLAAMLLYCGAYDIRAADLDGSFGGFLRAVLWSYSGTRDFLTDAAFKTVSVANYVTDAFPPTFISAGNADPLGPQSVALAEALEGKGVFVDTLFYPADFAPPLGHEYQFHLDLAAARTALRRSLEFLGNAVPRD